MISASEVEAKFGVSPNQIVDYIALAGDASDNIPGIPGIGEKTAKLLIAKYGSLEKLLENTHELKGKQQENVINFAEQGRISKMLATIICDVDVEFNEAELEMCDVDAEKVLQVFTELEFRTLAKRVIGEEIVVSAAANQICSPHGPSCLPVLKQLA